MADHIKSKPLHRFIPSAWKRWYMFFRGIANGEVTSLEEEDFYLDSEDKLHLVTINITKHIFDNLYDETFREPLLSLPTDLNEVIPTESILFELKSAADKILVAYNKASVSGKQTLDSLNVNDQIRWIIKCSQFIIDLVDNYRKLYTRVEDDEYLQFTLSKKYDCDPSFSLNSVSTLYHAIIECCRLHNIKTFEDIDNQKFVTAVCCCNKSQRIKPTEDCGMIVYAIICILSTICQDQYSNIDTGRRSWADILLNDVIDWTNLPSAPLPSYWLRCYVKNFSRYSTQVKRTVCDEDKKMLSEFLGRPAFEDLCKLDNIAKYSIDPYSCDEYKTLKYISCITENRSETLKLLYKVLSQETTYLLNIELSNLFMDKEEAEQHYVMSKVNYESTLILDSCIDEFYLHQTTNYYVGNNKYDLGDILLERHSSFRTQYLYQYPLASSAFIRKLMGNFIDIWKSPVCVTPEAQVPLTLESKFRMTPIKS